MAKIPVAEPRVTTQEKVYNLYVELLQARKEKKEAAKMHSENIKRIEEEIEDVLEAEEEETAQAQRDAD